MVELLILDLSSGQDLVIREFEPHHIGLCTDGAEPAWDSVSPTLSAPSLLVRSLSLSLSQSKSINIKKKMWVHSC